jgi:hypothetical protein
VRQVAQECRAAKYSLTIRAVECVSDMRKLTISQIKAMTLAYALSKRDDGIGSVFLHRGESALELRIAADPDSVDRRSGGLTAKLYLFEERLGKGIGRIGQSGHAARRRQHVADQLDTFAGQCGGYAGDPGDISARARKGNEAVRVHHGAIVAKCPLLY